MAISNSMTVEAPPLPFVDLKAQRDRIRPRVDAAIARVLEHGQFILGPEVHALEDELKAWCGARHAIACANGTDALTLVLMAEGVGPGDAVFVPSFTFVATAEVVAERLATPFFVDILSDSFNMDAESLTRSVEAALGQGLRPRMVIAVDLFGQPADYAAIGAVARTHGLTMVADAAQSFGGRSREGTVGTLADYSTTSFFPAKPLGCYGDGGAVFTSADATAELLRSLLFHGKGENPYDNVRIGLNSRLDTLQAAILIEKLRIFADEIAARNAAARAYTNALAGVVTTPTLSAGVESVWAQYTVLLPEGVDRARVQALCRDAGVPTGIYYPIPLHRQTGYAAFPGDPDGLPVSDGRSERVISLPMHAYLDACSQERIVTVFANAVAASAT